MKKILVIITLLSFVLNVQAQKKKLSKGDKLYLTASYDKAIDQYESELKSGKNPIKMQRLADAYFLTSNMEGAANWYQKALDTSKEAVLPESLFRYSQALRATGNNKKANSYLKKYWSEVDSKQASAFENNVSYLESIKSKGAQFEMINLGVNSKYSDFGAIPFGNSIVFATARPADAATSQELYSWNSQPYLDLYVIEVTDNQANDFITSSFSKNINSEVHESSIVFTKDRKRAYFSRNNVKNGKKIKDRKKINHINLYKADFIKGEWINIEPLKINKDNYSMMHPTLSPDEKTLFFASDIPGSLGDFDIFAVELGSDGNTVGEALNVGPAINTKEREQFPFMGQSGTLFFSSNGHPGFGQHDVFKSEPIGNNFSKPENLGLPLNGAYDDFAFYIDERTNQGYISSNRPGGKGDDDIYAIKEIIKKEPEKKCEQFIAGKTLDKSNNQPVTGVEVKAFNLDGKLISSAKTTKDGTFMIPLNCKLNEPFKVTATTPGYLMAEQTIKTEAVEDKKHELPTFYLTKRVIKDPTIVQVNDKVVIDMQKSDPPFNEIIYFDYDKWNINAESRIYLDAIAQRLKDYPQLNIEIASHTDERGSDSYNKRLSQRRAKSTKDYLINKGISTSRLSARGYGESQPVIPCASGNCTESEYRLSRRSQFEILNY